MAARTQWALTTTEFPELDEDRMMADRARAMRPDLASMSSRRSGVRPLADADRAAVLAGRDDRQQPERDRPGRHAQLLGESDPSLVVQVIGQGRGRRLRGAQLRAVGPVAGGAQATPRSRAEFDRGVPGLEGRVAEGHPEFAALSPASCATTATAAPASGTSARTPGRPGPSSPSASWTACARWATRRPPRPGRPTCSARARRARPRGRAARRRRGGRRDAAPRGGLGPPLRRVARARPRPTASRSCTRHGWRSPSWPGGCTRTATSSRAAPAVHGDGRGARHPHLRPGLAARTAGGAAGPWREPVRARRCRPSSTARQPFCRCRRCPAGPRWTCSSAKPGDVLQGGPASPGIARGRGPRRPRHREHRRLPARRGAGRARRPTRPGPRCSWWRPRSWWTSARSAATR